MINLYDDEEEYVLPDDVKYYKMRVLEIYPNAEQQMVVGMMPWTKIRTWIIIPSKYWFVKYFLSKTISDYGIGILGFEYAWKSAYERIIKENLQYK